MSSRRPTIADVARRAGVAPSTASVVFSGKSRVAPETQARVREAAAELGYTGPDPLAASLRRGRSGIVAVVLHGGIGSVFLDPVATVLMDGLAAALAPLGAGLLLLRTDPADAPGGSGPTLDSVPIDAAVLLGSTRHAAVDAVRARGIPVVAIEGEAESDIPTIALDNREAEREIARHLAEFGHRDVAIVTLSLGTGDAPGWIAAGTEARIAMPVTAERLAGAREVFPDAPAYAAGLSLIDEGLRAGRAIFAAGRPTAVIAQSDLLAAGVIRAAEEAGLRVPQDVSVAGFDGVAIDGIAPYRLTTMVQPAAERGRAAGDLIAALLEGRDAPSIRFTSTFREGNTTGPAPPGGDEAESASEPGR
ncbi:substrate-binding domain-containing protein [Microbacterium sp. X-17]|uniref:LacI family DNA-binding transcriptional regulator n=1 Tax=Microbacterium sp. X-17 TaxID=3144404 RepID=UPI0031F4D503